MTSHHMTAADYRSQVDRPRGAKFGNVPTTVDGIRFDSLAEARFYAVLKLREKAGEVADIKHQEPFDLKGENGQVVAIYKADFVFWDHVAGRRRVVDVKGGKATQTAVFRLKAKLMQATHGITVEVEAS